MEKNSVRQLDNPEVLASGSDEAEIVEWYRSLGPNADLHGQEDQLFDHAMKLYLLSTQANEEIQHAPVAQQRDYFWRLDRRQRKPHEHIFSSPEHGLMAAVMTLEVARLVDNEPKIRRHLLDMSSALLDTVSKDPRLEGWNKFGGQTRYEAAKYILDIEAMKIRDQLKQGQEYQAAEDEFQQLAKAQVKKFHEILADHRGVKDGEVYEHFVELVGRFTNWRNQELDKWAVRAATPREDQPSKRLGHRGKKFATDIFVESLDSLSVVPVQAKLDPNYESSGYDHSIVMYDRHAGWPNVREHMGLVADAMWASYKFEQTDEQDRLLKSEVDYFTKQVLSNI